jgi:hypothetical protein
VFKEVPRSDDDRPWLRRVQIGLLLASLVLAAILFVVLL